MSNQKIGLYIGKFQPFHNGHLSAVQHSTSLVDKLIVVIGSSQYEGLKDQPFSAKQRRHMIEASAVNAGLQTPEIIEVPDIHDAQRWVDHLLQYVPHFDVVFTNNEIVRQLFEEKGFAVSNIPFLEGVSGTLVRQKLADNDDSWQTLVPEATVKTIISID